MVDPRRFSRYNASVKLARLAPILVCIALVTVDCSMFSRSAGLSASGPRGTHPPTSVPSTGAPTPPPGGSPFAVGTVNRIFTDTSREISGAHTTTGRPGPRVLPTQILYPATGSSVPGVTPVAGATPAGARFPLVVFAPGFDLGPSSYLPLLASWARAGYVVAAVMFPLTGPNTPGGPDEYDIVNQPADVRFVITQVLEASRTGNGTLSRLVDPAHIAVAGHSDGAQTAILVGAGGCCRDPRVDAIVPMSGANLPAGAYFESPIPTLVMQGTADPISPESVALNVYAIAKPPKYLLLLKGAGHLPPFSGTSAWETVVREVSIEFLNRYIGGGSGTIAVPAGQRDHASLAEAIRAARMPSG